MSESHLPSLNSIEQGGVRTEEIGSSVNEETTTYEDVREIEQRHPPSRSPQRNAWMGSRPFTNSYHQDKFNKESMEQEKYTPTSHTELYARDHRSSFLERVEREEYDDSLDRGYRNVREHIHDEYSSPPIRYDGREHTLPPLRKFSRDFGHFPIRGTALTRDRQRYQTEDHRTRYISSTSSERFYPSMRHDELYIKDDIRKNEGRVMRMETEPRRQWNHQIGRPYSPQNTYGKRWIPYSQLYRGISGRDNRDYMDSAGELHNDHTRRYESPYDSPRGYRRTPPPTGLVYQQDHDYPYDSAPLDTHSLRHIRERIEADTRSPLAIDNRSTFSSISDANTMPYGNGARSGALYNPSILHRKRSLSESDHPSSVTNLSDTSEKPQAPKKKRKARICKTEGCTKYVVDHGLCIRHGGGKRCSVEGCGCRAQNKGLCWKHGGYTICTVEGCTKRAKSRGICWSHGGGTRCKMDGCEKVAVSHGLCWAHGGGKRCIVDGCKRPGYHRTSDMCNEHFQDPDS